MRTWICYVWNAANFPDLELFPEPPVLPEIRRVRRRFGHRAQLPDDREWIIAVSEANQIWYAAGSGMITPFTNIEPMSRAVRVAWIGVIKRLERCLRFC